MTHATHQGVSRQEAHYFFGIAHMACHAQRQSFDALQNKPCGVRTHTGAKITQALTTCSQQESTYRAFFVKHHVVKAFIGLCEFRKLALSVGA